MTTRNRVECHVIAGLGGFLFARGTKALDQLFDDLSPHWDATHWWHGEYKKCAQGIIDRQAKFKDKPTVILIGHSYGALRCQQIAKRLNGVMIKVHYIGCIDATALPIGHPPMMITGNVQDVDEFWATSGFPHWRRKSTPSGARGGKYIIPDHWKGTHAVHVIPGSHIPCASNERTRAVILDKVKGLV